MPLDMPLGVIDESVLQKLVLDGVAECKTIEYKLMLPGTSDADRKEFLGDAASFANAAGGHLIYGVKAVNGQPVELCGLPDGTNADAEILGIENSIRTGIAPRIPGVHSRAVPLQCGRMALVVRIPRSFGAPHMVTYKGTSRFYSRSSNGKYQLDVGEIRTAFMLSGSAANRCRDFRLDRLAKIQANETPVAMAEGAKVVVHISLIGPPGQYVTLSRDEVNKLLRAPLLSPVYQTGYNWGYNFDGIFTYTPGDEEPRASAYLQLFRSGDLETVNQRILKWNKCIPSTEFEEGLLASVPKYFQALRELEIDPPVFVMLTLIDVLGFHMGVSRPPIYMTKIDRHTIICPEILVDDFSSGVEGRIKRAFDVIWNAAGWAESPNYRGNEWIPDRR
jgi:hypothetical protein